MSEQKVWFLSKDFQPVCVDKYTPSSEEEVFNDLEKYAQLLANQNVAVKWCDLQRCGFDNKIIKKYKLTGRKTQYMPFKDETRSSSRKRKN